MSQLLVIIVVVLFVSLSVYLAWYNSPKQKGKRGAAYIHSVLMQLSDEYTIIDDVILPTEHGTTQIDHVVVSKYGIIAIETKNYRGEIYGDDNRKEWTQMIITNVNFRRKWWKTYTYVTKNHFYNPVKQSIGHAMQIKNMMTNYPHVPVTPVVVFAGSAVLKGVNSKHAVIYDYELLDFISQKRNVYLNDSDVSEVLQLFQRRNMRTLVDDRTHVKNIKQAVKQTQATINAGICPKCGGQLLKRNGKYGSFYGCSNYPNCKFTTK